MDRWLLGFLLLGFAPLGCGRAAPAVPTTPASRIALAELPGLRAAPHLGLQSELALVEQDRGLPLQLTPGSSRDGSADGGLKAADRLKRAFPALSRNMVAGPLAQIYSGGPLALSPVQLERGRELIRKQRAASELFRQALPQGPDGWGSRLADGILADVSFLEPLTIGCRLEAVAAAIALADEQPHDALPHLATQLRAARLLAAEPSVTARVAAADLRSDALSAVESIANHPRATHETHEQLLALLTQETAEWPSDARAWIGDRAAGLLVYELVRDGQYLSLLAADEVEALQSQSLLAATGQAAMRNIDEDEQFYLQAMRRMIQACEQPYHERQAVLADLRGQLADKESSADYPLIAGKLLLADFETGHRRQAEDFARTQAWMLALGTALGRVANPIPMNSLTGAPYRIETLPLAVTVSGVLAGRDEPCGVPIVTDRAPPRTIPASATKLPRRPASPAAVRIAD